MKATAIFSLACMYCNTHCSEFLEISRSANFGRVFKKLERATSRYGRQYVRR